MEATDDLPVYASRSDAPRDHRTADELAVAGLTRLGAPAGLLTTGMGSTVALYSTSEARRLRDGMWPRASTLVERAGRSRKDDGTEDRHLGGTLAGAVHHGRRTPVRNSPLDWIADLFETPFVVVDTETTGLGARAEIIEIAVVAADGATLYESLVWPHAEHVPSEVTKIHGLTLPDLEGAPTWPSVLAELDALLRGHRVIAWNAPFDDRMARQSSRAWRVAHPLPGFECAMRAYAYARGVARGSMRLERAAAAEGVLRARQTHRSADDARLTLALLRRVMEKRQTRA